MIMPGFWKTIEKYNDEQVDEATFTVAAFATVQFSSMKCTEIQQSRQNLWADASSWAWKVSPSVKWRGSGAQWLPGYQCNCFPLFWGGILGRDFKAQMEQTFKIFFGWFLRAFNSKSDFHHMVGGSSRCCCQSPALAAQSWFNQISRCRADGTNVI